MSPPPGAGGGVPFAGMVSGTPGFVVGRPDRSYIRPGNGPDWIISDIRIGNVSTIGNRTVKP